MLPATKSPHVTGVLSSALLSLHTGVFPLHLCGGQSSETRPWLTITFRVTLENGSTISFQGKVAHAHTSVDLYPSRLACHDNELTFRMALTRADQTTNTLVASRRNGGCQRKIFLLIGLFSEIPHTISTWCIPEKISASKASGKIRLR